MDKKRPWHARAINKRGRLLAQGLTEAEALLKAINFPPCLKNTSLKGSLPLN